MQVLSLSSQSGPNFGLKVSLETIRKANQACIERVRLAKRQGLTLAEYKELQKEDNQTIGSIIAKYIIANKAILNKAYGNALRKIVG